MKATKIMTANKESQGLLFKFLDEHASGVLATVDADNNPHGAAIYYTAKTDFSLTFMTKAGTKKSDNLRHNNHATFVIYDEATQTSAQIRGRVYEITDDKEAHDVFRSTLRSSLHTSSNAVPPISKLSAGSYIAYKLVPVEIRLAIYDREQARDHQHMVKVFEFSTD